jgi:hypothetical protein
MLTLIISYSNIVYLVSNFPSFLDLLCYRGNSVFFTFPTIPSWKLYCCSQFNWKPEKITSLQQISVKLLRGRESVLVFYCLLIYVLLLEIQLSRGNGADSITCLNRVTFLCPSQDICMKKNMFTHKF